MQLTNNVKFYYSVIIVNSQSKPAKENWNFKVIISDVNLTIVYNVEKNVLNFWIIYPIK